MKSKEIVDGPEVTTSELIKADYERVTHDMRGPSRLRVLRTYLTNPGFKSVYLYRKHRDCFLKDKRMRRRFWFFVRSRIDPIVIYPDAVIGPGLIIAHPQCVVIGSAKIGSNCCVHQGVTIGPRYGEDAEPLANPRIGDNVTIYAGAKILGNITIGNNVVIGANAVVLTDMPSDTVGVGIPARAINRRASHET
jgi:serine O-acetyltransferase